MDKWVTKFTCLLAVTQQNESHLLLFAHHKTDVYKKLRIEKIKGQISGGGMSYCFTVQNTRAKKIRG